MRDDVCMSCGGPGKVGEMCQRCFDAGKMKIYDEHVRRVSGMMDEYPPLAEMAQVARATEATPDQIVMSTDVARQLRKGRSKMNASYYHMLALMASIMPGVLSPEERIEARWQLLKMRQQLRHEDRKRPESIISKVERQRHTPPAMPPERVSKRARRRARGKGSPC
jgi:hypothetical protein